MIVIEEEFSVQQEDSHIHDKHTVEVINDDCIMWYCWAHTHVPHSISCMSWCYAPVLRPSVYLRPSIYLQSVLACTWCHSYLASRGTRSLVQWYPRYHFTEAVDNIDEAHSQEDMTVMIIDQVHSRDSCSCKIWESQSIRTLETSCPLGMNLRAHSL